VDTDLARRIELNGQSLGAAGRRVVATLLDVHDRLGFFTAAELAELAATTDATVVRTAQHLGYQGLVELKRQAARDTAPVALSARHAAARAASGDHVSAIATHLDQIHGAINRLRTPLVITALDEASCRLARANRIVVAAAGLSSTMADYAQILWQRHGLDVRTATGPDGPGADALATIRTGDAVVRIASGAARPWTTVIDDIVSTTGATSIVITDAHIPAGVDETTIVLPAGRGHPRGIASHTTTLATIEALAVGIDAARPDQSRHHIDTISALRRRLSH